MTSSPHLPSPHKIDCLSYLGWHTSFVEKTFLTLVHGFLFLLVILLITVCLLRKSPSRPRSGIRLLVLGFKIIEFVIKLIASHSASVQLNGWFFCLCKNLREEKKITICNRPFSHKMLLLPLYAPACDEGKLRQLQLQRKTQRGPIYGGGLLSGPGLGASHEPPSLYGMSYHCFLYLETRKDSLPSY